MRRSGLIAALLLSAAATPAVAELTTRVHGLEEAVNDAWQRGASCHDLLVEDLAFRDGSFALTTSATTVFRLSREDRGGVVCFSRGWRVAPWDTADALSGPCGQELCSVLEAHPALTAALEAALVRAPTAIDEAPVPLTWSTPAPKGLSLVWFLSCAATLLLLLVLPLIAWTQRPEGSSRLLGRADWLLIILIAFGGTGLRATVARTAMVELDETVSVGYDSLWREFDGRETVMNPPLYRLISAPVSARTQGAAMPGRIVPVLLGFVLVLTLGLLGAQLGGRRTAFVAALLAAVHPWLVMATVYHRSYAPLVVTTSLTLLSLVVAFRSGRSVHRYVAATCMAATFLSHYSGAAVVAGAAIWILIADGRRWRSWIGPAALTVLLCAPFVPAALSGAHAKGNSPIGTAGASHAARLALSMMSVVGGFIRPRLETPVYLEHQSSELLSFAALTFLLLVAGAWRLPRRTSLGLLLITFLGAALPPLMAWKLTTVREFQGVEAVVPALALLAGLALPTRRLVATLAVGAVTVVLVVSSLRVIPFDAAERTRLDAVSSFVRGEPGAWPVLVWSNGSPSFSDVALDLGVSRPVADASYEGRDEKVRALRSCSTAAVREAARHARPVITILSVDPTCDDKALAGRAVQCEPTRLDPAGFAVTSCHVDTSIPEPRSGLPSLVPAHLRRRVDRAIPPGHEALFMGASAPFVLGKADARGNVLSGISIGMEYAKYQLSLPSGPLVTVLASPRFEDEEIDGTQLTVEPAEETLSPESRAATQQLKEALTAHLTTSIWNDVYGLVTNGAGGHTPVRATPWLVLSAFGGLVLIAALIVERRRRTAVSE